MIEVLWLQWQSYYSINVSNQHVVPLKYKQCYVPLKYKHIWVKKKKRGPQTLPHCFSPTHQAGIQGSRTCCSNRDILFIRTFFSILGCLGNLNFSSSSSHSFLQLPLLSTEHSATPRNPFTTYLLHRTPASRPSYLAALNHLCSSVCTKTVAQLSLYLGITVRRSFPLTWKLPLPFMSL